MCSLPDDPSVASAAAAAGAAEDHVRRLTAGVRSLPASGRGAAAATELTALLELSDAVQSVLLERLAVLDVDGVAERGVALTARGWLRREARCADVAAGRLVGLARRLHSDAERPLPVTAASLSAGDLTAEQAHAIADATAHAPVEVVAPLEEALVTHARHLGATELRRTAAGLVQVLRDQQGDDVPAAERERGGRYLRTVTTLHGCVAVDGVLDAETGSLLRAVLDPLAAPVPTLASDGEPMRDPRSAGQRLHDALHEALTLLAGAPGLPQQGGARPGVQVVVDAADLVVAVRKGGSRGGAFTRDGLPVAPDDLDRMRCDPHLSWLATSVPSSHRADLGPEAVPMREASEPDDPARDGVLDSVGAGNGVLDSVGTIDTRLIREALRAISPALGGLKLEVLAAGRQSRLVTAGQRRALNTRDRGCVVAGCLAPAPRCQAHHLVHWSEGGATDLSNLALVCPAHHRFLHEQRWALARGPDGRFVVSAAEASRRAA